MQNIMVLNVFKGLGALSPEQIDFIENISLDRQSSPCAGSLDSVSNGFDGIGNDSAKRAFDLTKESMFNRRPLGGIGRVVCNTQASPQAFTEIEQILSKAQRSHPMGPAGIEGQQDLIGLRRVIPPIPVPAAR
jgi:hypothetical protein